MAWAARNLISTQVKTAERMVEAMKSEIAKKHQAEEGAGLCVNQPVRRVHRQFFTKSFLGDDAAVLAWSIGEEPASPRRRAGVASMAWRTTRRCSANAP